jgi:hypothetical protein
MSQTFDDPAGNLAGSCAAQGKQAMQRFRPSLGAKRRPSDFQFKVHLIRVALPGILLAVVWSQRPRKHPKHRSYWTVHWTPLDGRPLFEGRRSRRARLMAARPGMSPSSRREAIAGPCRPQEELAPGKPHPPATMLEVGLAVGRTGRRMI